MQNGLLELKWYSKKGILIPSMAEVSRVVRRQVWLAGGARGIRSAGYLFIRILIFYCLK